MADLNCKNGISSYEIPAISGSLRNRRGFWITAFGLALQSGSFEKLVR